VDEKEQRSSLLEAAGLSNGVNLDEERSSKRQMQNSTTSSRSLKVGKLTISKKFYIIMVNSKKEDEHAYFCINLQRSDDHS
jgi:hypothetical protein